jgi:hypothetical protein
MLEACGSETAAVGMTEAPWQKDASWRDAMVEVHSRWATSMPIDDSVVASNGFPLRKWTFLRKSEAARLVPHPANWSPNDHREGSC